MLAFGLSLFGYKGGICLLIAPVPVHCFLITFMEMKFYKDNAGHMIKMAAMLVYGIIPLL